MKKLIFIASLALFSLEGYSWGQKGHDTVAYIAEQHLTPLTRETVDSLLDGRSLVYWANWLDNASHTPEYEYTKTWHYKNIDPDYFFENAPNIPEGNIIQALYEQVKNLQSPTLSKKDKSTALKMIVHFMGDIHQPMHMGRALDRGGNSHFIKFFGKPTNLHSVWDTNLLEAGHAWSHTEWQREIDVLTESEKFNLVKNGSPDTWGKETYAICEEIYSETPQDYNIEYSYIARWTPVIELQLEKGGLRLADVLNSIFDPDYQPLNSFVTTQ